MIITQKYLNERKADIMEAKRRLTEMPNFKPQQIHGMSFSTLKKYTRIETVAEQRRHYIKDALCRGLYLTSSAPKSSQIKHLESLRDIYANNMELLDALRILEKYIK